MRAWRALAIVVCALSAGPLALAQDLPPEWRRTPGRDVVVRDTARTPDVRVELGWDDRLIAYRWNPIRVEITGAEAPVGGMVIVEHGATGAGSVEVAAPYGVAPGSTTPVEVLIPAGIWIERLIVTVTDEGGRPLRRVTFADWREMSLAPPDVDFGASLVGVIGAPALESASRSLAARPLIDESDTNLFRDSLIIASRNATAMPVESMGYDALDVLVVAGDALRAAPEPSVAAARQWVERGGRLVLVADSAGGAWRRWIEPGLLEVGELRDEGAGARRTISISDEALRLGWRSDAAAADGPVGLGWVTVCPGAPADADAWDGLLSAALADRLPWLDSMREAYWWAEQSAPGADEALNAIAEDLGAGARVNVWPVLAGVLALALLLGPVDWFVLKRRRLLHRSWLTALGWIGLASAAAYFLPLATLSTRTGVRVVAVEDVAPGGSARIAAMGVLPGSGGVARIEGADASWWRPVSAGWNEPRFLGAMPLAQAPGEDTGAVPAAMSLRVRSLRALLEQGAASEARGYSARAHGDGYTLRVPDGRAIVAGALRTPEGWWTLERADDGTWTTTDGPSVDPPRAWSLAQEDGAPPWVRGPSVEMHLDRPGAALALGPARLRWGLMERRIERGGWCVALVVEEGAATQARLTGAGDTVERRVTRITLPIERAEGSS
ncbi:MAG: hypothetical protein ACF8QF_05210 [Phycisphaerales bacterium]